MSDVVVKQPKYMNVATGDVVADWATVVAVRLENPEDPTYRYWQEISEAQVQTPVGAE